jgi:hypothetical protein
MFQLNYVFQVYKSKKLVNYKCIELFIGRCCSMNTNPVYINHKKSFNMLKNDSMKNFCINSKHITIIRNIKDKFEEDLIGKSN